VLVFACTAAAPAAQPPGMILVAKSGDVYYANGSASTPTRVRLKTSLPEGAAAITGPGGRASIRFPNGHTIALGSDTRVRATYLAWGTPTIDDATIVLESGALAFDVKRMTGKAASFRIRTKDVAIPVRYGRGIVVLDYDRTRLVCRACRPSIYNFGTRVTRVGSTASFIFVAGQVPRAYNARLGEPEIAQFGPLAR